MRRPHHPRPSALAVLVALAAVPAARAQLGAGTSGMPMRTLHAGAGHPAEKRTAGEAYSDATEVIAAFAFRLREANPAQPGSLVLEVSADTGASRRADHLLLRIPLSGQATPAAAGAMPVAGSLPGVAVSAGAGTECRTTTSGERIFTFVDVMPGQFPLPFQPAPGPTDTKLVLNQTLCHALAATYTCNGAPVRLPQRWAAWKLARTARIVLSSQTPSTLDLSPVVIAATETPFAENSCR